MTSKLLLTTAAATFALAAPPVAAAAPSSFTDPTGDNGTAVDLGVVTVQLASDGYIHIRPAMANQPALNSPGAVLIAFDTDRSLATGAPGGTDFLFVFVFSDLDGGLLRWDGSAWVDADVEQGDARYIVGGGGFEFLVRPAALGGATAFNFRVAAATGDPSSEQMDMAPDQGTWLFEATTPAVVETIDAKFVPAAPKAGTIFQPAAVRVKLSNGTSTFADSYRCVATLGGRLLRGTGRGGCTFKVPKNAKGKRLAVTLFVTYKGTTDEFKPYVFRVR